MKIYYDKRHRQRRRNLYPMMEVRASEVLLPIVMNNPFTCHRMYFHSVRRLVHHRKKAKMDPKQRKRKMKEIVFGNNRRMMVVVDLRRKLFRLLRGPSVITMTKTKMATIMVGMTTMTVTMTRLIPCRRMFPLIN